MRKDPIGKRKSAIESIVKSSRIERAKAEDPHNLPEQKDRLVTDIKDAGEQMKQWAGASAARIFANLKMYRADDAQYEKAIGKAIRQERFDIPQVRAWIAARRSLGDRKTLRRYKDQRLERGVKGGISKEDLWLLYESHDLINGKRGYKAIRQALINRITVADEKALRRWKEEFGFKDDELKKLRARLKHTSLQNFRKWCKRLGILWSHQDERLGDDKQETRVSTTKSVQI